jgi:hypothetical protein
MLEAKIRETGWHAQVPDEATFDLVFSKEVRRDVRKGSITIEGRAYAGPVLATLTGAKQVPFLVPMRDPEGPIMCLHNGTIHKLHHDSFALNDREGAKRKGAMVKLQNDHVKRLIAKADQTVDVQQLLSDSADLGPVMSNAPDAWTLDKAGVMGGLLSEEAAAAAEEARNRQELEEYLASKREVGRGARGGDRNHPSSAT